MLYCLKGLIGCDDMKILAAYAEEARKLSRQQFVAALQAPMLVHTPEDPDGQVRAFKTTTFNVANLHAQVAPAPRPPPTDSVSQSVVYPLVKRPGGAYPHQIGVGRTRNADICLEYPEVSKFHAYFVYNEKDRCYTLTDAGATNGTFVDGVRLKANQAANLRDGSRVMFGPHEFTFYLPEGFQAYCIKLAARG